jgi:glycosyltransferase involved in cell wall biosynthesis
MLKAHTMSSTLNINSRARKVLAVDLECFGHHAAYIQNIAKVWVEADLQGSIEFLLTDEFRQVHSNIVDEIRKLADPRVTLRFLSNPEEKLVSQPGKRYWNGWKIYCQNARTSDATQGLLLFLDSFQLPIWLGEKSPIPFSGIYFRPTFHYGLYQGHHPTLKERLVGLRKSFLLQRVLSKQELGNLLSVDATAAPYIRKHFHTSARVAHFPDSFPRKRPSQEQVAKLRRDLGIESNRMVFCMIGILDNRKGPLQLIESIQHIPEGTAKKICILLVGRVMDTLRQAISEAVLKVKSTSNVQVVLYDNYIPPGEIQSYYTLSDVMLTTYQFHKGSSSALIHAAYEKKPVLSSDFGWLGHMVRTYKMGIDIDSSDPEEIALGISKFANSDPREFIDCDLASQLANDNSQEQLAQELELLLGEGPLAKSILQEHASHAGVH